MDIRFLERDAGLPDGVWLEGGLVLVPECCAFADGGLVIEGSLGVGREYEGIVLVTVG